MHLIYSHNKLGAKLQTILTMQLFDFNDDYYEYVQIL